MKSFLAFVVGMGLACRGTGVHAEPSTDPSVRPSATVAPQPGKDGSTDAAQEFDEQAFLLEYRSLLARGELDEAEKQLTDAMQKRPDSSRLQSLHVLAYSYLRRAGRNEEAFGHLQAYVEHQMARAASSPGSVDIFAQYLAMLVDYAGQLGGPDRAFQTLDELTRQAQELKGAGQELEEIQTVIAAQRAVQLAESGRADEAQRTAEAQLAAAEEAWSKDPNDPALILRKAAALKSRVSVETAVKDGDPDKAWSALLDFLFQQIQEHGNSPALSGRFQLEHIRRAAMLARTDPDSADALLDRIEKLTKDQAAPEANGSDRPAALPIGGSSQIAALRQQIEKSRRLLALVGSPAMYPENVDGWVNGEALTPDALKGKVVLLDFFAVWCGPCIATFPHLCDWHDEYHDKGLQIIGVTNYYKYGWDQDAGRAARQAELEPEAERAAMEQFVKHHGLRHQIAYVMGRELQDFYGVSGIPHAVLIDRQGKVRLFRIGSGDQNAADLKQAIEECLAEAPPAE